MVYFAEQRAEVKIRQVKGLGTHLSCPRAQYPVYPTFRKSPPRSICRLQQRTKIPMTYFSPPLRQHILEYEPPRGFSMSTFAMFDDSNDPYDHKLHFHQAMTSNAGNDHLLCKVFPASVQGPTLVWFHRVPRNSMNSFREIWTIFISQYLCSVRQKRNISSLQTIIKQEEETIRDFTS